MYSSQKRYNIVLRIGQDIHNIQEDEESIFQSFNLPSWLNSTYDMRILYYGKDEEGVPYYTTEAKAYNFDIGHDVKLVFREIGKDYDLRIIDYEVIDMTLGENEWQQKEKGDNQNNNVKERQKQEMREKSLKGRDSGNKITVVFQKSRIEKCLFIRIIDTIGMLDTVFDTPAIQQFVKKSHLKQFQLQYPYIQPQNYRIIEQKQKQHLHLAFQGGGVKGFAYIGAYKALKDIYQNINIKSIIGSSAGSMIALAICSGSQPEQLVQIFKEMDNIPKDKIIKSYHELNSQKQYYYNDIKIKIRKLLHDYGLIQNNILDLLVEDVFNNQIIDKIMEVMCGSNESLKEMFSMEVEEIEEIKSGCCFKKSVYNTTIKTKLVNYYGLLEGKLMKGKQIEQISLRILKRFLINKHTADPALLLSTLKLQNQVQFNKKLDKLSLHLTMKQFYILSNETQFTATGVDLDNKILRFFNHKTTPHLPVTKAIQMSGSFPIAFQALKWKKQWGKYYIHYNNIRREIDLEGHTFTDGGMLANFPIMYLDNEQMRPMYFSHKRNEKTKIFGFGLEEIPKQQNVEEIAKHEKAMEELSDMIKKRLPIFKFIWTQLVNTPDPQKIPISNLISLSQIPILNFIIKIMQTYLQANQNFVKQCFINNIYILQHSYSFAKFVMEKNNNVKVLESLENLKDSLIEMYIRLYKEDIGLEHLIKAIGACIKVLDEKTDVEDIIRTKRLITSNLTEYSLFLYSSIMMEKHSQKKENKEEGETKDQKEEEEDSEFVSFLRRQYIQCNNILTELKDICVFQIIAKAQSYSSDIALLKYLAQRVKRLFDKNPRVLPNNHLFLSKFNKNNSQFFNLIKTQLLNSIELIIGQIQQKDHHIRLKTTSSLSSHSNIPKCNTIYQLNKLYTTYPQQSTNQFKLFQKRYHELCDPFMKQQIQFQNQQINIKHYIHRMIFKRKSNNIHVVFQGKSASTKFYMDIYKLVNQEIFMLENTKWKALAEKIARKIIKNTQKVENERRFEVSDLVMFLVLKNDLIQFVQKKIFELPLEIDLNYVRFSIPPSLKQQIDQKVNQFRQNSCKITSITCSNIHAFLGFMIAGGLKQQLIQSQLIKLRDDFETDIISIEQQFKNNNWMVPFKSKIREFQDIVWQNRYDIFKSLEKSIEDNNFSLEELNKIKEEFEKSKEVISDTFVTILDYIVDIEVKSINKTELSKDISSQMSLNTKNKNYIEINKKISEDTRVLINYLFQQFHDQLKLIVMNISSSYILQFLTLQKDVIKKQFMWKGIIISKFMKIDKYKHHVHNLLRKMNLPKDINLKQFNQISPRKIELNFPAVDITYSKQVFINFNTYPQMPIWAALLTALSFPVLFPEVRARPGWIQKIFKNRAERNLSLFFNYQEDFKASPVLTSGNMLNSFPLQLLTNTKMRERCFEGKEYTFLSFGVEHQHSSSSTYNRGLSLKDNPQINYEFNRKFLGFKETIFLGTKQIVNGLPRMAEAGSVILTKGDYLTGFIDSHDNLMVQMYNKQLLRLPIRIGTLDFHILKTQTPLGIPITTTILEQTYYYTLQKFAKNQITYIRVEYHLDKMKLIFLSKQRKCKDLMAKYKIEHKSRLNQEYEMLVNNEIEVNVGKQGEGECVVYVRIHYVNQDKKIITWTEYGIGLEGIARGFKKFSGVYALEYSKIMNCKVRPSSNLLKEEKGVKSSRRTSSLRRSDSPRDLDSSSHKLTLHPLPRAHSFSPRTPSPNISIKSVVNLTQNGLFCTSCCATLTKLPNPFIESLYLQQLCNNCSKRTSLKYICSNTKCQLKYCIRCVQYHIIERTKDKLYCFLKHEFEFRRGEKGVMEQGGVRFARCDICLKTTEEYYEDRQCGYRVCQPCCANFILI